MAESTMSLCLGLVQGPLSEYLGKWWPGEAGVAASTMSPYLGLAQGPLCEAVWRACVNKERTHI